MIKKEKTQKIKGFMKRVASGLVSAAIALQTLTCFPMLLSSKVSAASAATGKSVGVLGKVNVELLQNLTYVDKDTFTLDLELKATYAVNAESERRDESTNGYYRVAEGAAGKYLLQLWGGDGANVDGAGSGGLGGYVYGVITLQEGDILYYRIGGDGVPVVNVYENEGGANGGAGHGEQGSSTVGGGGGYSAFFLFTAASGDAARFATEYLNENGDLKVTRISETDRISKHIMIAGGGGGGGAVGSYASQTADGGGGGYVDNKTAGKEPILITGGTVYPGGDGMTTGGILIDNLDSVRGKGGLDVPQDPPSTLLGVDDTKTANNWEGTNNLGIEGGAGGASEWRGGAGGAGYAGGTGGIMTSQILPTNVSGGGGGSSYVSDLITVGNYGSYEAEVNELLSQDVHHSESAIGGEMRLVYLDVDDLSYLDNVTIAGEFDRYFDVSISTSNGNVHYTPTVDYETSSFSVSDINLNPGDAVECEPAKISVTFTRKEGFMGGNNVPIISADYVVSSAADVDDCPLAASPIASYANVPLAFAQHANETYTFAGSPIPLSMFYTDEYESVRDRLSDYVEYDFIDAVGEYEVYDTAGNPITSDITSLYTTTVYQVRYVVSPKDTGYATVGPTQWDTVYTHLITILVEGTEEVVLHPGTDYESTFSYRKMLRYDAESDSYVLSMVLGSTARTVILGDGSDADVSSYVNSSTLTVEKNGNDTIYTAPYSGYYMIQLWGASGGAGGVYGDISRAIGGTGGYVSGYIYLEQNEVLKVHLGAAGATPTPESNKNSREVYGGTGGECSYVTTSNDEYLLIASGGGGGSGAGKVDECYGLIKKDVSGTNGAPAEKAGFDGTGTQPSDSLQKKLEEADLSAYNGETGATVSLDSEGSPAAATAGANNYKNSAKMDRTSEINSKVALLIDVNADNCGSSAEYGSTDTGHGEFQITPLQVSIVGSHEQAVGTAAKIGDYYFSAEIEPYFTVTDISYEDFIAGTTEALPNSINAQSITIENLEPTVLTSVAQTANIEFLATTSFQIDITLKPTEGFLGGNDVPILTADGIRFVQTVTPPDSTTTETETGTMEARNDTDYANVAMVYDSTTLQEALVTSDKTIVRGDSVPLDDLFDLVDEDGNEVTISLPNDWRADYVTPHYTLVPNHMGTDSFADADSFEAATVSPNTTTTYKIQVGVAPKYDGDKAVVIGAQTPITAENEATVYVLDSGVSVTYDLTDLTHNHTPDGTGSFIADALTDFTVTLSPTAGYVLPGAITVAYANQYETDGSGNKVNVTLPAQAYSYDSATGVIRILAIYMNDSIKITAAGILEPHWIHFHWQNADGTSGSHTLDLPFVKGDALSADLLESLLSSQVTASGGTVPVKGDTSKVGHTFLWDYGDGSKTPPSTMPGADLWVTGLYTPNEYTVTVTYVYEGGGEASPTVTETYTYGTAYNIVSPTIPGYLADVAVVSGTAEADRPPVTVTYTAITGQVIIYYLYEDGTTAHEAYNGTFDANQPYSITSPTIEGYTPDTATVSGTMDAIATGVTVTVTYTADTYTVTFDYNYDGGGSATRQVTFNTPYSIDAEQGLQVGLPTPRRTGYTFLGWATAKDAAVSDVTEATVFNDLGKTTLYALWDTAEFTVTIHYLYEDGTEVKPADSETRPYGEHYCFTPPTLSAEDTEGYNVVVTNGAVTPATGKIEGTFERNMTIIVRYVAKTFNLEVLYVTEEGTQLGTSGVIPVKYKATYSHTPPAELESGGKTLIPNVTKVTGTMSVPEKNTDGTYKSYEVIVTYYPKDDEVVIEVTVAWEAPLTFTLIPGNWNAETHSYGETTVESTAEITLTNNSTLNGNGMAVTATLSYQPTNAAYSYFDVSFTHNGNETNAIPIAGNGSTETVTLTGTWTGSDPPAATAETGVGLIKITITRAGG